jgi:riboflavin synthase
MFTGIITDVGRVRSVDHRGDTRFTIETVFDVGSIDIGASIACSGVCLTVVDKGDDWFAADVSAETLSKTTLGGWKEGGLVNLERSLKVGDELGGHIVTGHIDGVAAIISVTAEGASKRFRFEAPRGLARYIAPKGSIALNGVSLTVNEVEDQPSGTCVFGVNIIPHTQEITAFRSANKGDRVNLEVDVLARYVARMSKED